MDNDTTSNNSIQNTADVSYALKTEFLYDKASSLIQELPIEPNSTKFRDWKLTTTDLTSISELVYPMTKRTRATKIRISIGYNPIFKDMQIIIRDDKTSQIIESYISKSTIELDKDSQVRLEDNISNEKTDLMLTCQKNEKFIEGNMAVESTLPGKCRFHSVHSEEIKNIISQLSNGTGVPCAEIEKVISDYQPNDGKYIVKFEYDKKHFTGEIYIDNNLIELNKTTRQYNITQSILLHSKNLIDKALIEDVYSDLYQIDYYEDSKKNRSTRNEDMYQLVYRVNQKIREKASIKFNLIERDSDYYQANDQVAIK